MQSFLRKLVTHHKPSSAYTCHRNIFHTHTHTPFSSLPSPPPSPPQLLGRRIPSSFFPTHHSHSSPSCRHSLPPGIGEDLSNAILRGSSRRHLDCRGSWFRRNGVVLGLIMTNVAVYLLWKIADEKFMIDNFTISLNNFKSGRLHTLITNAFSHRDAWHTIFNMILLYFCGKNVEGIFGPKFLLKLYLAAAVGGAGFYLVHQAYKSWRSGNPSRKLSLGASDAVNAILLINIFVNIIAARCFDFITPVPAIGLGIFIVGMDMLGILKDCQTSRAGHLGAVAVAAIAWARRGKGIF